MTTHRRAWTAFWLSVAVPGAGQLLGRSWTAMLWICLAAAVSAVLPAAASVEWANSSTLIYVVHGALLLGIGVASGAHARRMVLRPQRRSTATSVQVSCRPAAGKAVRLSIAVATNCTPDALWRIISDLPQFLTVDPFHERVTLMRREAAAGVHLVLDHSVFGFRLRRTGRILAWREGESYSISDLSTRGKTVGFPHVFTYRVEPAGDDAPAQSVLRVEIRGKWTSPVIPAWLGRLWLAAVCYDHARLLRLAL
jgi:hypothetical protein